MPEFYIMFAGKKYFPGFFLGVVGEGNPTSPTPMAGPQAPHQLNPALGKREGEGKGMEGRGGGERSYTPLSKIPGYATDTVSPFTRFSQSPLLGIFPQILGFRESTWDLGNFPSNLGIFMRAENLNKILVNRNFKS